MIMYNLEKQFLRLYDISYVKWVRLDVWCALKTFGQRENYLSNKIEHPITKTINFA